MFFWSSSGFASSRVWLFSSGFASSWGCYFLLDFRGCTAHSILLTWFLRLFLPSQLFARSRIRGVLSGSTGRIVLSTVRHFAQLARLPPIFSSSTGGAVLSTVRHLAQLARLPSSFLSSLTLRQPGGRGGSSDADDLRSWLRKAWSLSYAVFVSCSLVRGIGFLSTSSRTTPTLQLPPVRGRPGGFDGNGGRSSPVVVTSPSVYGSLVR